MLTTIIYKKKLKKIVFTYNNDFYFVLHELTNQRKV